MVIMLDAFLINLEEKLEKLGKVQEDRVLVHVRKTIPIRAGQQYK